MKTQPLILLEEISRIYTMGDYRLHALDKVTLKIEEGEFVAVMGPSGSGKSTLMNLLGLLDRPDEGEFLFDNQNVEKFDENQRSDFRLSKVGFVFQNFNLLSRLTALKNVILPLVYQGVSPDKRIERGLEVLTAMGIENRVKHKPSELSGGQQQRVAIARALITQPKIILADEPTGNLDSHSGEEIMKILTNLNKQGITIIMVTHENFIADYAHRTVFLRDGRRVES